jgi:hypothetical protein
MTPQVPTAEGSIALEAQRIEEDALYSSRGHFGAAKRWSRLHFWLGLPAAVGAAIAGAAALNDKAALSAVVAMAVTAMTATLTFLNPSDKANTHHSAGTRFNALRNSARRFREVTMLLGHTPDELAEMLAVIAKDRDSLNDSSPQIPRWAFLDARRSLEAGEAAHAVDCPRK